MKTRKSIAGLLSFLMVLSLLLGISAAPVYAVGGEGATASFEIRGANGQTGTVQYKLDGSGDFITANDTSVNLSGVSSITIKAIPNGNAQVNQSTSGISGPEQAVTFGYAALISDSGWTYNIQDNDRNIIFTIEFDNSNGTGGGSDSGDEPNPDGGGGEGGEGTYTVYFGEGSWEIGGVIVTANKTDVQYLAENDIITLENFDPETMEVRVEAEDGFWTTLAVTDGQTSISAHTNDGGVPADIAFSVVSKSSNSGGEYNGNTVHANVTVEISGEELEYDMPWSNDAADFVFGINGSEMRRLSKEEVNYVTEGDKIVGLVTKEALVYEHDYDDSGTVTFHIKTQWDDVITSLIINDIPYNTPQTKDDLINAFDADFRGIRFDIENVPYAEKYHIVVGGRKQTQVEKIMGNFGWTYDPNINEYSDDDRILYGNLEFVKAVYNNETYNSIEEVNAAGGTFQWDNGVKGTDDPTGEAMLPTGTELTLRLIPDAGYQLTALTLNGIPFEPGEEVGLYTFTTIGGNWHLGAYFTQVGDEVQANSVNIKSGNININEDFEYGTAKLEVSDVASMSPSRMEEFENTATDEGYEIENYLDISLYNAVYKGGIKDSYGNYESWDTPIENIEDKAAITLELENDMSGKELAVIHEQHNGEQITGYELINAVYNEENNTITFESDSFSHYAIVSKEIGGNENLYYIDLGTGSWTIGDVTVSVPEGMSGVVPMLDTDTIPTEMLANFDPDTMDAVLIVDEDVTLRLNVDENGNTRLADVDGGVEVLPPYGATLTFAVVEKSSNPGGGENPGENVYYIDLGTGSWTVGDVTVSAPEGMSGVVSMLDTETIPTEMLANFDPETMDITLTVGDGFVIYLEIDENGSTTLASTRDGVELPPYGETLIIAVVAKPGNLEIVDKTEENACDIALEETADVLLEKLGLSDTEATRNENGENIQVWIEAEDISETVEESDKQLIESKKGNAVVAMYLNIELYKKIGNDTPSNVTQTKGAITFTIKVPDAFVNTNGTVTRTYQIIRVHNGTAEVLPCTFDAESQIISFETDQFSTYALAYIDQQNSPVTYTVFFAANGGTGTMADATGISGEYTLPANGFTAPSGKQFKAWSVGRAEKAVGDKITVTANTTVTAVWEDIPAPPSNPDNPQTGDNTHIGLLFVMLLISACGMIVLLFVAPQKKGKYQR